MMELKDFVALTLNQLVDGVKEAQKYAHSQGAKINPSLSQFSTTTSVRLLDPATETIIQEVKFDISLTTQETANSKGGVGIFVGPIALGTQAGSGTSNQSVGKIQFSVPIVLPKL